MHAVSQHHASADAQTDDAVPISALQSLKEGIRSEVDSKPFPTASLPNRAESFSTHPPRLSVRKIPPRRIALSGGGVRTIAHCGALLAWKEEGVLDCVEEYLGVSGGAFIALILCLGYTLEELKRLCIEFDFNLLNTFDPDEAFLFLETLGLDTGHALEKLLISILKHKGYPSNVTFDCLRPGLPILRVYATNLSTSKVQEFSIHTTPKAEVLFAIRSSMSLPLYYTPMREPTSGHTYVDGGVLHNLPMAFLTPSELHDTWGIMFSQSENSTPSTESLSLFEYMKHLYNTMLSLRYESLIKPYGHRILRIPCGHISPIQFAMSRTEKESILQLAYSEAKRFVVGKGLFLPTRRNSVG